MQTEVYKPLIPTYFEPTDKSVLVVEDDAAILDSLCTVLRDEGFVVHEATDGLEALRLLRAENVRPNLILLDLIMPHMGGAEFLAVLEKEPVLRKVPVAMLSAARVDSLSPLAVANLAKPVEIEDLLRLVHYYLDQPLGQPLQRVCC